MVFCFAGEKQTYLLHDTGLALGECNVAARLVADELDLNLATLAADLILIIVIVIGSGRTLALDATSLGGGRAIANRVRLVEVGGRGLVVLVGDVCHLVSPAAVVYDKGKASTQKADGPFFSFPVLLYCITTQRAQEGSVKGKKWWRCCFERGADGSILDLASSGEKRRGRGEVLCFLSQKPGWARALLD